MYKVILAGASSKANSDTSSEVIAATVEALTSFTLLTLDVYTVKPISQLDSDLKDGAGSVRIDNSKMRKTYSLDVKEIRYPSLSVLASIEQVLNMDYLFLKNTTDAATKYNSTPVMNTDGYYIDVVKTGYSVETDFPNYNVMIELAKRKINA